MLLKKNAELNKIYRGALADVSFTSRKGADKCTLFSIAVYVPKQITRPNGKVETINIPYGSRIKSITSDAQHAFTVDPLLCQVYEFPEEELTTEQKIDLLRKHIGEEVAFMIKPTTYESYDEEGNKITKEGYEVVYDESQLVDAE